MLDVCGSMGELASGRVRARDLIDRCLQRIEDPSGQGRATFLEVYARQARAEADAVDALRASGAPLPPLAGIPVSVKDLFDVAGSITSAGSKVLRSRPPAERDAAVVARLRASGLIVIGRTNMTELAYSGLGLNPHYGTPLNPFDRSRGRIPGGSSSGAAVSVTDGMAAAAIGTDTGGSCRVPAAFTGIVGFKPTANRVSREGVTPLSITLDSVGPLVRNVADCVVLDAVLSGAALLGERIAKAATAPACHLFPLKGLRLLVPRNYVLDDLDAQVAAAFERCSSALAQAGAAITSAPFPELSRLPAIHAKGGFSAAECYAEFGELLDSHEAEFDPRVATRIAKGREQTAVDYLRLLAARAELIRTARALTTTFDAVMMPTVPCIAPVLRELEEDAAYFRANALALRNAAIANFLDRCAISIPVHRTGEAPVGLMLMGEHGEDAKLLAIARTLESLLSPRTAGTSA
ncbi:MAG TPA: amidase [Steroidobacteraceae bacterium]|nr:amidase [Steroidobacteraceae bacterium]